MTTQILGHCDPKFEAVKAAFEGNFAKYADVGASVAVTHEGKFVVDLWGGLADAETQAPWQEDTIVNVYSSTKTMSAMALLLLADRGEVDLYAPAAKYWPEFAQNGKAGVEVRHFLSHSAGLPGLDEKVEHDVLYDWERMTGALARQAPWWAPGTQSGYHAVTQGYLMGEIVRRITGQTIGNFFRTEIAEPLGADFHIGTPASADPRIGTLVPPPRSAGAFANNPIASRTFDNPPVDVSATRTRAWRAAEIPAAGGHGNARSIVRIQTAMANGGAAFGKTIMSEQGARRVFDKQTSGEDLVLGVPITFGMGYGLSTPDFPMGPNERIAYWGGYGGSTVVIDQDARLCVSYVMNRMEGGLLGDRRGYRLLQAAYASLA